MTMLQVIIFPGGQNWPLWVAQDKGFFARENIEVTLTPTPGSVFQLTNLIAGKFDIGLTAPDNVIAYQEGQGEAPVEGTPDLFAFMGGSNAFLRLVVLPEIKSYADLRGKELSVDALTTGFAFVLREMLEKGGLKEDDYKLVRVGGTLERWEALKEKKHAGTLLNSPFDLIAEPLGFRKLGNGIDVLGHYEGMVGAARRSWARTHGDQLVGFIRAYVTSLGWLYDRGNKAEAIEILHRQIPQMSPELASKIYEVFFAPSGGMDPRAKLDMEGLRTVLKLRSKYTKTTPADPARYYDLSYYERALKPR
jgi:ABC-type nitrate/sulfonate/bicarbonate transport system substrate-binding protein